MVHESKYQRYITTEEARDGLIGSSKDNGRVTRGWGPGRYRLTVMLYHSAELKVKDKTRHSNGARHDAVIIIPRTRTTRRLGRTRHYAPPTGYESPVELPCACLPSPPPQPFPNSGLSCKRPGGKVTDRNHPIPHSHPPLGKLPKGWVDIRSGVATTPQARSDITLSAVMSRMVASYMRGAQIGMIGVWCYVKRAGRGPLRLGRYYFHGAWAAGQNGRPSINSSRHRPLRKGRKAHGHLRPLKCSCLALVLLVFRPFSCPAAWEGVRGSVTRGRIGSASARQQLWSDGWPHMRQSGPGASRQLQNPAGCTSLGILVLGPHRHAEIVMVTRLSCSCDVSPGPRLRQQEVSTRAVASPSSPPVCPRLLGNEIPGAVAQQTACVVFVRVALGPILTQRVLIQARVVSGLWDGACVAGRWSRMIYERTEARSHS